MRSRDYIAPLRERPFRLMFGAQATSVIGDQIAPIAIAFAVLELTGSAVDLGIVLAARTLPMVLFTLAGGVWADRLPRNWLMVASDLGRLISQGLLAVLLLVGVAKLWHVVALQAVAGTATAFFRPAATGLTPSTVSRQHLQQANALLSLTFSSAQVAGPAIAGLLVATVGPAWAIAVDAATFGVSALFLSRLTLPPRAARAAREPFLAELRVGWNEVRSRTWLWGMIALFAVFQFSFLAPFFVLGPLVADRDLGGAAAWALIVSAYGLGAVVGGMIGLRWHPKRPLVACNLGVLLVTPPMVLLGTGAPAIVVAAAAIGAGAAMSFGGLVWETVIQQNIAEAVLSRVAAYDWVGSTALRPIGYAAVGPISAVVGVTATLEAAAAITAAALFAALAAPSVRGLSRAAQPDAAR